MINKKLIILVLIATIMICIYVIFSNSIGDSSKFKLLKKFIPLEIKTVIKKTFYPNRHRDIKILVLEKEINYLTNEIENFVRIQNEWINLSLRNSDKQDIDLISLKPPVNDIINIKSKQRFMINNINSYADKNSNPVKPLYKKFKKNFLIEDYYLPLVERDNQSEKPLGYIDKYNNNIIFVSGNSRYIYSIDISHNFKITPINNNLSSIISGYKNFIPSKFGIKDILIKNNFLYVSYTNEEQQGCYNLNILYADLSHPSLNFKKLNFSNNKNCIYESDRFNPHAAGGRIQNLNDSSIFLSYGSFSNFEKLIGDVGYFGKNILINTEDLGVKVISNGHRNVQGLYYDSEKNILLSSEHGPKGGDEINLIKMNDLPLHYGWPFSSYGEHYDKKSKKLAPLKKTHKKYGYEEPLIYFTPSIGISEINKCNINFSSICDNFEYLAGSMGNNSFEGDMSLIFFNSNSNKIIQLPINRRVRDMIYLNNKLVVLSENKPAISLISQYKEN